jgi:hypothetical protein
VEAGVAIPSCFPSLNESPTSNAPYPNNKAPISVSRKRVGAGKQDQQRAEDDRHDA